LTNLLQSLASHPQFCPLSISRALWKRKVLILVLALLGAAGTVAIVSKLPPIYTANAVILVESQKIPESFVAATVQTALEAELDTLKQQVLSRDRLWGLVEKLDLYRAERGRLTKEEVLELMRLDINITLSRGWSARGPGAFQVEYAARKPEIAAEVTNQIGMFFINENLRQRTEEAVETSEFLDRQLEVAGNRLREQEARLKEFKLTHNGELPQQEAALLAAVSQSRAELLGIQEELSRVQQNKLILEGSLAYAQANLRQRQQRTVPNAAEAVPREAVPPQPAPPTALEQAQSELGRLRARYQDSHPEVQRMRLEVQRLAREGAQAASNHVAPQPTAPGNPMRVTEVSANRVAEAEFTEENNRIQEISEQLTVVARETQGLEERRQHVLQEVQENQARLGTLPVREQQLAAITRDYDTSKANYQSLLNKKLAADVAADMERGHKSQKFVMLDPARVPQKPTRPRRVLLTAAGSLFSFVFAAGLAFLLELRKSVLLGEWELPSDIVTLGRIPRMEIEGL